MINTVILSFLAFLIGFTLIGAYASRRKSSTTDDYLLASRSIGPWFTAMSAVSTNNSGFMFIGLIGTSYTMGLSAIWIIFGWIFGDYLMWFWIHRRLREESEAEHFRTIPSFLGAALPGRRSLVRATAAVVTITFLGTYAAAQLNAGSKALHVLFGWPYAVGAIVGAVIVVIYCFAGGIRASIWTDVAQSINMIIAIWLLFILALMEVGGLGGLWSKLEAIDPQLISLSPPDPRFGFALFIFGWFGAGIGVVGQPHIMVRMMSIRSGAGHREGAGHLSGLVFAVFVCVLRRRVHLPHLDTRCGLLRRGTGAADVGLCIPAGSVGWADSRGFVLGDDVDGGFAGAVVFGGADAGLVLFVE